MAREEGEDCTRWEILLTAEVETFLDDLYESDPVSHQLPVRMNSSLQSVLLRDLLLTPHQVRQMLRSVQRASARLHAARSR